LGVAPQTARAERRYLGAELRNLVYTGVTRGRRLVVLVGQRKALAIAVKGVQTRRRWSKLREWLGGQ
jgi:exodeoxyribonuclease V alpha subunit